LVDAPVRSIVTFWARHGARTHTHDTPKSRKHTSAHGGNAQHSRPQTPRNPFKIHSQHTVLQQVRLHEMTVLPIRNSRDAANDTNQQEERELPRAADGVHLFLHNRIQAGLQL
jgi:hypothetical protein